MNLNLLKWILQNYTEPGEVVLDPMAGTGSTVVLAALEGRHSIAVEFEPKFCEMIKGSIDLTRNQTIFKSKGRMAWFQGDARKLSELLLKKSDIIISSPPYGNRLADVAVQDGDQARMGYKQTVDVVLTSPPYEGTLLNGRNPEQRIERLRKAGHDPKNFMGGRARNVTLRNYDKPDIVITSPPGSETETGGDKGRRGGNSRLRVKKDYAKVSKENIGRLPHGEINAVITSPPYETGPFDHAGGHGGTYAGGLAKRDPKFSPITINEENIGSMKGKTYLEAMLQVYRECHKMLKSGGTMVLIVKNFIRDRTVVRLDLETIKLCEAVGFRLADRWYFRVPTKSFWKILYKKNYPEVPEIEFEDILIFEKN